MAEFILLVMGVAAVAYVVLGGADFGAGAFEWLLPQPTRRRAAVAIAPVWEANHVWLVLVAVLAFVAFPRLYVESTTYLHVPLMLVLLGIVARGAAFTFRHYEPQAGVTRSAYSRVYRLSSLLTPVFLGVSAAALVHGGIGPCDGRGFYACYIAPWNTLFGWACGLFLTTLFMFQGAALLAAESPPRPARRLPYLRLSRALHFATILTGAAVFGAAWVDASPWLDAFLGSPVSLGAMALATLLLPAVALAFHRARPQLLRLVTGAQTTAIMVGFFAPNFPVMMRLRGAPDVRFPEDAAPPAVLDALGIAVAVGLVLIVPALGYLISVYKFAGDRPSQGG